MITFLLGLVVGFFIGAAIIVAAVSEEEKDKAKGVPWVHGGKVYRAVEEREHE